MKGVKPLLVFDIGNTNITVGVFISGTLARKRQISTGRAGSCSTVLRRLLPGSRGREVEGVVVCSVVPAATAAVKPLVAGKDFRVPLKNLYKRPEQVGQDRLVNAYAAVRLFGAPLIAVDYGTAVTFDAVSAHKEYLGGLIVPGMDMQLRALNAGTALLPAVKLRDPSVLLGRDTADSILSGVVHGMAALTEDICRRIKNEIGNSALIVGTGGNIAFISKHCKMFSHIEPHLTLKGLQLLFNSERG
jgi:type III pantothenate kinase